MEYAAKDSIDKSQKRERLLEAGFRLFSSRSIESVRLDEVAKEAGVGIATLYRYFENKPNLVIEIGIMKWIGFYKEVEKGFVERGAGKLTAAERLEYFLNSFINLYCNHKDILVFNRNFDTYVKHEGCTREQMERYNEVVSFFATRFHGIYLQAKDDGTLDIRISEKKLFVNLLYIMLSVSGKYAEGLIYPADYEQDMTDELLMLKKMVLDTYTTRRA